MGRVSSYFYSKFIYFASISLVLLGLVPWSAQGLPHCNVLLVPSQVKVESLTVSRVEFSKAIKRFQTPNFLESLTKAILQQPIFVVNEPKSKGFKKAIAAVILADDPVPHMTEFYFIPGLNPDEIVIEKIADFEKDRILWYYDTIAKATLPPEPRKVSILGGYLADFEMMVYPQTIVKLSIKHQVSLAEVVEAFSKWHAGPARTSPPTKPLAEEVSVRYYFVSEIRDGRLIKVVFDWYPQAQKPEIEAPRIKLISAYPVPIEELHQYEAAPKDLE